MSTRGVHHLGNLSYYALIIKVRQNFVFWRNKIKVTKRSVIYDNGSSNPNMIKNTIYVFNPL